MIEDPGGKRLVLLARRDLPWNYRAVQAAHAAAAWAHKIKLRDEEWGAYGPTFVMYLVDDAEELEHWAAQLGEEALLFREPDLGGEATALAWWGEGRFEGLHLA